jgi:alpha-mannosidase
VTWATLDAPLVEIGGITAGLIGNAEDPKGWLAKLPPSQTIYSWVMNNYWPTNYKAFQSGPTVFRYRLLPHGPFDQAAAQRFGIESSQPLLVRPAQGAAPSERPLLELDTPDVIVASIKPSDDRRAIIVRLFAAAGKRATTRLHWERNAPKAVWRSNLAEERVSAVTGPIEMPGYGLVTLRAE